METIPNNSSLELINYDALDHNCCDKSLDIELMNIDFVDNNCCNESVDMENMEVVKYEINSSSTSSYTSLKDLPNISPLADCRKISWKDIPIKDRLVQHAAYAYLYPMAENEDAGFVRKMKGKLCGVFGCFNDVVLGVFKAWFINGDEVEEHKEEEEEDQGLDRRLFLSELDMRCL